MYNIETGKLEKIEKAFNYNFINDNEFYYFTYPKNTDSYRVNKIDLVDFELYKNDTEEKQPREPYIRNRFEKKIDMLNQFQNGKDIWEKS